jgi:hypothetical protein
VRWMAGEMQPDPVIWLGRKLRSRTGSFVVVHPGDQQCAEDGLLNHRAVRTMSPPVRERYLVEAG